MARLRVRSGAVRQVWRGGAGHATARHGAAWQGRYGQLVPLHGARMRRMTPRECHDNVEKLSRLPGLTPWAGFAACNGRWTAHSWGVDAHGRIVETTHLRNASWGVPWDELGWL
jgi:hypothetical protein